MTSSLALDDAETYKLFRSRRHDRHLPVRIPMACATSPALPADSHRRSPPLSTRFIGRAPSKGGMIDDFINRKQGKTKVSYELPQLKDILEETLRRHLVPGTGDANCQSPGEFFARRGGHPSPRHGQEEKGRMAAQRAKFMTGCAANKIPEKKAERIFNLMEEFAGYGFNKSHSCAYALLAYQTAFLKTHYPVEFMARC